MFRSLTLAGVEKYPCPAEAIFCHGPMLFLQDVMLLTPLQEPGVHWQPRSNPYDGLQYCKLLIIELEPILFNFSGECMVV